MTPPSQSRSRPATPGPGGPGAPPGQPAAPPAMLAVLTAAAFVIFAQIFMVAPILPALARAFATTPGVAGLTVPAYLIPEGRRFLVAEKLHRHGLHRRTEPPQPGQ